MDISALQASTGTTATSAIVNNAIVQSGSETTSTTETKDKYASKLAEIASRYDVTHITPRQMLALSKELYDNKLISSTDNMFLSFQPEVWDPNAPQTYPGPKKLGPDDPRDMLSEWREKSTYQRSSEATNNCMSIIGSLEKVNALPHDQVASTSATKGGGNGLDFSKSSEVSGALQSEVQKAVAAYKNAVNDSTLDYDKIVKLLETLNIHRKASI
jgi:hypothetical protein